MGITTISREKVYIDELVIIEQMELLTGNNLYLFDELEELYDCVEVSSTGRIVGLSFFDAGLDNRMLQKLVPLCKKLPLLTTLWIIDDLIDSCEALVELTELQDLQISSRSIKDISPLLKLRNLKTLDVSGSGIRKLGNLSQIPALQSLNISQTPIRDITKLYACEKLEKLSFCLSEITDYTPFAGLEKLKYLDLSLSMITDLISISRLKQLQYLSIRDTNVTDITALSACKELQRLDLHGTDITDIRSLSQLTLLEELDLGSTKVFDLNPLASLKMLKELGIDNTRIFDISPLSNLQNLLHINLERTRINDLTPLYKLTGLQHLYLAHSGISRFDSKMLVQLQSLRTLSLKGNNFTNIPNAITQSHNCLFDLINYYKDDARGNVPVYESKVILTGNGRVGKTSLVNRWLDNTFNPAEPSTHAIQLRPWLLNELAQQEDLERIRLNIWDFGGQDIYHATHRTFMHTEAIFILVWDIVTETQPEQEELLPGGKTVRYKNYPITYWLSYIKILSNNSPVIVVQTKRSRDKQQVNILTEVQQKEYNVQGILSVENSTITANGFATLKERVQEIVLEQIKATCKTIPASWYQVRNRISILHEEQQVRQIPVTTFEQICMEEGVDQNSTQTLLDYFHNTSIIFYRSGLFNDQIVIDQKWAIDAVYTLFDRKGHFARIHNNGQFTRADLQEFWSNYTVNEQALFLSFMQQCEICFEARTEATSHLSYNEAVFIAPQLLPELPPLSVQALRRHGHGVYYKYRHRFLHSAIIQRFIVRTGNMAKENEMWQTGIVLDTPEGMALIEATPQKNEITIRLDHVDQKFLLNRIRNEMGEINADEIDIEELVSLDGVNFVHLDHLKKNPGGNESVQAENGKWVNTDKLRIFLDISEKEVFAITGAIKKHRQKEPKPQKTRTPVPQVTKTRAELQKEINNKCPFCGNEDVGHLQMHHIDENPGNNKFANLILVCPTCHSKINKRDISKKDVKMKKKQLAKK